MLPLDSDPGYFKWSVVVEHSKEAVRDLIQYCYKNEITVDTSVAARVAALDASYRLFSRMSSTLLIATFVLSFALLFTTVWFDASRKIHSVGIMLSLGVRRRVLVLSYSTQFYILVGILFGIYLIFDQTGAIASFAKSLDRIVLGGEETLTYQPSSPAWVFYMTTVLLAVPIAVGGLRYWFYRKEPAALLSFRD